MDRRPTPWQLGHPTAVTPSASLRRFRLPDGRNGAENDSHPERWWRISNVRSGWLGGRRRLCGRGSVTATGDQGERLGTGAGSDQDSSEEEEAEDGDPGCRE